MVPYPAGIRECSLFQNVQTLSGAHPASCSMNTGAWSWKLNSVYHQSLKLLDLYFRVVHMLLCGAEGQLYLIYLTTLWVLIRCTVHLLLLCTMTNKCTIIWQIVTLLHVSILRTPWRWHNSVETCSSVIICEIIVLMLVIAQDVVSSSNTRSNV